MLGAQASLRLPQSLSNGCANRIRTCRRSEYRLRLDFAEGRQRRNGCGQRLLAVSDRLDGFVATSNRVVDLLEESRAVGMVLAGDEQTRRRNGQCPPSGPGGV